MRIEALYFAQLKDLLKKDRETFELPTGSKVSDLLQEIKNRYEEPFDDFHLKTAVNEEFVGLEHSLADEDRVAFLPPVSGG